MTHPGTGRLFGGVECTLNELTAGVVGGVGEAACVFSVVCEKQVEIAALE
ncbi:hypothetical protein [Kribbella rubisoli]|nr:hypothetical protein [Kribbella rubisoli]